MKKQQILITYAILLCAMILTSFRIFPDQRSTLTNGSAFDGGEKGATLIGEDQDARPPREPQTLRMDARIRKASKAQVDKYRRMGEISGSESLVENSTSEESSNEEPMTPHSPISEDRNIP